MNFATPPWNFHLALRDIKGLSAKRVAKEKEKNKRKKETDAFRGRMQLAVITRANSHTQTLVTVDRVLNRQHRRVDTRRVVTISIIRLFSSSLADVAAVSKCELFDSVDKQRNLRSTQSELGRFIDPTLSFTRNCISICRDIASTHVRDNPTNVIPRRWDTCQERYVHQCRDFAPVTTLAGSFPIV